MEENLDCDNIIEINQIRQILQYKKDLLEVFDNIIKITNQKINIEEPLINNIRELIAVEDCTIDITITDNESDSEWSEHTSDEEFMESD